MPKKLKSTPVSGSPKAKVDAERPAVGRKPILARQIVADCKGELFRVEYECHMCSRMEVWHALSFDKKYCAKCGLQMSCTRKAIS